MINGERVRQAREFHGLTQTELAGQVGLDQSAIAHIEAGRLQPSQGHIEAIAFRTGFPPSFFSQNSGPDFPLGSLQFRSHATVAARDRVRAYRYGQLVHELANSLLVRVKPLPLAIGRLDTDPVTAANVTRSALSLSPDRPILNLVHTIEKAGVLVLSLPTSFDHIDAFSAWVGDEKKRPTVVLTAGRSGDRLRLSLAHDLGHLVLPTRGSQIQAEREAFLFGAELLLPTEAMRSEMILPLTLTALAKMKERWGVSIQALIRRAKDLNIITTRRYHYLFQQLGARGWRMREPVFVPIERPRAVRKMAELLYGTPIDYKALASDSRLTPQFVRDIVDAHATSTELPLRTSPERSQTRVIDMDGRRRPRHSPK